MIARNLSGAKGVALLAALAAGTPMGSIVRADAIDPPCPRHVPVAGWPMEDHAAYGFDNDPRAPDPATAAGEAGPEDTRDEDRLADTALVETLIEWVGAHSNYDFAAALADPPKVLFCEAGDRLEHEDAIVSVEPHMRGIYDNKRGVIRLVRPWTATNPRNVSTLLHELVHHVQWREAEWSCTLETEWEAYRMQKAFLEEHGLESGFDWLAIFMASRCQDGTRP